MSCKLLRCCVNQLRSYKRDSCDTLFASDSDTTSSLKLVVYRIEYADDGDNHDDWDLSFPASRNGSGVGKFEGETRSGKSTDVGNRPSKQNGFSELLDG